MAFTEIEIHKINKFVGALCKKRSPGHIRDKLRYEYKIESQDVILFEIRPRWDEPNEQIRLPFAKLKFVRTQNIWKLFWQRADMKWHKYGPFESSRDLVELVAEIDADPHGCFFG
ncbi:MAG: DUF3024 domain-containing protein [Desulfobacterales bacterium]|jgi:hypothetical protein|nr:DUF3024 domain-containing protein [Desulfobacterales bacterium]